MYQMSLITQLLLYTSSTDIITVLSITCTESRNVVGAKANQPPQAGVSGYKTSYLASKEREQK